MAFESVAERNMEQRTHGGTRWRDSREGYMDGHTDILRKILTIRRVRIDRKKTGFIPMKKCLIRTL